MIKYQKNSHKITKKNIKKPQKFPKISSKIAYKLTKNF